MERNRAMEGSLKGQKMEVPSFLEPQMAEIVSMEVDGANKRRLWAVILGLKPIKDGDRWCILYGQNLHDGIAGFGDSPVDAIQAFEHEMYKSIKTKPF